VRSHGIDLSLGERLVRSLRRERAKPQAVESSTTWLYSNGSGKSNIRTPH
jgi:hypothetical protein